MHVLDKLLCYLIHSITLNLFPLKVYETTDDKNDDDDNNENVWPQWANFSSIRQIWGEISLQTS